MNRISMVIGSWGSYNECNERALGSKWLDFDDFEDWEEIETELKNQGFDLEGIDEELFIQDIEGLPTDLVLRNLKVLEVCESDKIQSSNIDTPTEDKKHILLRASCEGKPSITTQDNKKTITVANKTYVIA